MTDVLRVEGIEVVYDDIILAARDISLVVEEASIVALLGANGAGKTTTLKAASGLLGVERGAITRGAVFYQGQPVAGRTPRDLVAAGVAQVLEGRRCFPHLSVEDNLIAGALIRRPGRAALARDLELIYQHFPRLRERRRSATGLLSGGEQQMVAIGRALMSHPRLLLLDEPSLGLAPLVVQEIFEIVRGLNEREGVSVLLAEQNAILGLRYSHQAYVLENGRVVASGPAAELARRADVHSFYLGTGSEATSRRRRTPVAA
jgi:branched-chain amino acid transport system ATP-binding protein